MAHYLLRSFGRWAPARGGRQSRQAGGGVEGMEGVEWVEKVEGESKSLDFLTRFIPDSGADRQTFGS